MPVFRRSSAGETESKADETEAKQSPETPAQTKSPAQTGKGRPTPKRSEAERRRYQSIQGGTTSGRGVPRDPTRKLTPEEKAREKEQARQRRAEQAAGARRGDERYLPVRDRGPVKQLARDYVDGHRRPSEYYMYALIILIVALFTRNQVLETYVAPLVFALIAVIAIDGYLINRAVRKLASERCPGESTRGIAWYATMRAMQIRRMRNPVPRIKPGDEI
jgi:hypothetical protein